MAVVSPTLETVLHGLSRNEKLDRLALLCPSDAAAIELIIDDCLERRWPNARTWLVVKAPSTSGHWNYWPIRS